MILIDNRAGSGDLTKFKALKSLGHLCTLDSADACFTGRGPAGDVIVGIELKSLDDLISSSETGRLQATQIPKMLQAYDVSYLLYYGDYKMSRNGDLQQLKGQSWKVKKLGSRVVKYGYVEGILLTVEACGVRIRHVRDKESAANWIACCYGWWQKEWHKHKGMCKFDNSGKVASMAELLDMDPALRQRAETASTLPSLGYTRAMAAARHFDSIRSMVNADEAEWAKVDGVGKVVAGSVVKAVS